MFISIGNDNFESEIIKEEKPILAACIHRYFEFKEQIDVLESISKKCGNTLKICLMDDDFIMTFREKLKINGTPTFLIFNEGKVMDMMLGKVDEDTLMAFVLRALPYLQK